MKRLLIAVLLLSQPCIAQVYKWVDDAGRVHYSDKAQEGQAAETVEVRVNSYQASSYEAPQAKPAATLRSVTMYSTSWCGYCKKARNHFRANGIPFREYDIEKDQQAKRKYDALGGRGVPVILVGKQRMNGFNAAQFDNLYKSLQN